MITKDGQVISTKTYGYKLAYTNEPKISAGIVFVSPTEGAAEAIEFAGGTNTFVEDLSHITGKASTLRNKAIDIVVKQDLPNINFRQNPIYSPFSQTGVSKETLGTQIGKKSFASRTTLRDTIIHEELHHRWWERGIYDHHPKGSELEAKFYRTIERYFKMRGWQTQKEYDALKPRLLEPDK